jgi:hypothetical protein
VRLASINLNKRLGNPAVRSRLVHWLRDRHVDVLITQEPWKPASRAPVTLPGFCPAGGDGRLFTWVAEHWETPTSTFQGDFVQRIELGWLMVLNVYLDAYTTAARSLQLSQLSAIAVAEAGRPMVVAGDFNLAPRPSDGQADGRPSSFNNETDRVPFRHLLESAHLTDTTAKSPSPEFTVIRHLSGKTIEFRCDLALTSAHLTPAPAVTYDHGTRDGDHSFTDHSAILIDMPVTLGEKADDSDTLFRVSDIAGQELQGASVSYQPHKTAMARNSASPFARHVADRLAAELGVTALLDHGCGRGGDVRFYRSRGLIADGYDPHPGFGWAQQPTGHFDLVTQLFVLNVLSDPWQRVKALRHAAQFLRPGACLLAVTRSPADIEKRAAEAQWPSHNDGYWSSESKGTFQKGISEEEICALAGTVGLEPHPKQHLLTVVPSACQVLLVKPALADGFESACGHALN